MIDRQRAQDKCALQNPRVEIRRGVEYDRALKSLDRLSGKRGIDIGDVVDIGGVLADIKPAAFVGGDDRIKSVAEDLGLSWSLIDATMLAVSKNQEIAQELAESATAMRRDGQEEAHRNVGRLLGYPETATDYFIERSAHMKNVRNIWEALPSIEPAGLMGTVLGEFHQFVLSPDNWREEVEAYIKPMERATKDMLPKTYRRIRNGVTRQKMADRAFGLVGVRLPSHEERLGFPIEIVR